METEGDWRRAVEQTWVVRFPKQKLATFGLTNVAYYVVTEPIYQDLDSGKREGVVRTGRVIAERPTVVTPTYALNLRGFSSEAYDYFRHIANESGPNSPGILYQYKNEIGKMDIVGGEPRDVANNISNDLDRRKENLAVVMIGVDELWDVALLKFIYEFTSSSMAGNVQEFQSKGMLSPQPQYGGLPQAATQRITRMFDEVKNGGSVEALKAELDRWGAFKFYEEQFLALFRDK
jgi:hypothetical protein